MKFKPLLLSLAVIAGALTVPREAEAASIVNDLVVHLTFDGNYANSAAGSSVVASPIGAPEFGTGRIGSGAINVSSAADGSFFNYVTLGTAPELNFGGATDFTVSMWIQLNASTADPSFISNKDWNSGGNTGYVIAGDTAGNLQWNFKESGKGRVDYDGPAGTFSPGQWRNVIVSYDRDGNAQTFVDGVLVHTAFIGPATETLDSGFATNIGQDGTGTYTAGSSINALIDDVAIWRRALDAADAAGIYRAGTNGLAVQAVPDPDHPVLLSTSPGNGEIDVRTDRAISAVIRDGALPLNGAAVQMTVNGTPVTVTQNKSGIYTTVAYQSPTPLNNKTIYNVTLVYGDTAALSTNTWQFTTVGAEQKPSITGQWDFDSGNLAATIGAPLEYMGGPAGVTATTTQFGLTTSFGIPDINGIPARVMRFPGATTREIGYIMNHGAVPNGTATATKVNQWTMIMDVMITSATWFSFIQIDNLGNGNDGELFINPGGGIGISGSYQGTVVPMQWHRIAFSCDFSSEAPVISKFIDGVNVSNQARTPPQLDGRHALFPTALLFADEDGESQVAYVNSVQIRNYKMRDHEIAALGGANAEGIPAVSGQWDFNDGVASFTDGLKSTIGTDMTFLDGTEFGTAYETVSIGGQAANVMNFFAANPSDGYSICHGALPNGGGLRVNKYTLIMDLMYPSGSTGFRSLWQTATNFPTTSDGDLFVNGANGIGTSGQYHGNLAPDQWHRVAFTFDLTKRELGKYLNGTNVLTGPVGSAPLGTGPFQFLSASSGIVDQRWSLAPTALLFADEDGESKPVQVNSVQFRPTVLSADEIRRLGSASASGIPVHIPADLKIYSITPGLFDYTIRWAGGKPPYQVQVRGSLSSGTWENYRLPTTDNSMIVEAIDIDGDTAFIRVIGQ